MATKTISIEIDVYDRLKALKVAPSDSFSQVLRRLLATGRIVTGADVLRMMEDPAYATAIPDDVLDYLEKAMAEDAEMTHPTRKAG